MEAYDNEIKGYEPCVRGYDAPIKGIDMLGEAVVTRFFQGG